jgi:hypothetical protein
MRDKIVTAVCRTASGLEWTSISLKSPEPELEHHSFEFEIPDQPLDELLQPPNPLPEEIAHALTGDVTVALRTSELLLRTVRFPSADPEEIRSMAEFQIEKISPFPLDQLATSFEILKTEEQSALVLLAAAKRESIDAIGETFRERGIRVHSIDARILGWIHLLKTSGRVTGAPCEIILLEDHLDRTLVLLSDGVPLAFRTLDPPLNRKESFQSLVYEISYTLATVDAEYPLESPPTFQLWSHEPLELPAEQLRKHFNTTVEAFLLEELPPLSEGIAYRSTLPAYRRIELVPAEWIEHERQQQLRRKLIISASSLAAVWLAVLLALFSVYKVRENRLNQVRAEVAALEPAAQKALQNRRKLQTLTRYTDRSDSALECLREITRLLPDGDIKLVAFNYRKDKGVTLRGTASSDNLAYNYFEALTTSPLFRELKDQSVNTRSDHGFRRAVFSLTLTPAAQEATP